MAAAFRELREHWLQLSRDYATLAARPYDAVRLRRTWPICGVTGSD